MPTTFSLALPRDPAASALARRAIREHLGTILPAATLADVTLAVSELVANAVLHGRGEIELRIEADGGRVKGEVIDGGGGFERQIRREGVEEVGGRGLYIVAKLAESWGIHEGTTHVWFEIPVGGAEVEAEQPDLGHPGDAQLPDVDGR